MRGRKSVGAYDNLRDSSHGSPLRSGRADRCKRCPSALSVCCLSCGEGSQCPSYNSQKPFSSCAEAVEHIPFLLWKFSLLVDPRGNALLKGNHWNARPCTKTGPLARVPSR